jgi:hypothetical protein
MTQMSEPNSAEIKLTTWTDQYTVIPGGSLGLILVLTIETERNYDNNRPSY